MTACAWLVPGLCRSSRVFAREVRWLGVTYTTTLPTTLGKVSYALLLVATILLAIQYFVSCVNAL